MTRLSEILGAISTLLLGAAVFGGEISLVWFSIDSGGGASSARGFEILATIGQPDVGPAMTGGGYSFVDGFAAVGGGEPSNVISVPGDHPTIQAAIDAADNNDEIIVAPGTYMECIDFQGKAITLRSLDGALVTTIDAAGCGRTVNCQTGEGPATVLDGFTVTGGNAPAGGGMRAVSASPTVRNCTFIGNCAVQGGAMFNQGGAPIVTNCVFERNEACGGNGGAVENASDGGTSPIFVNCAFVENSGFIGGGMYNLDSSPSLSNCSFIRNRSKNGGAMFNDPRSDPAIFGTSFCGNTLNHIAGDWTDEGDNSFCPLVVGDLNDDGVVGTADLLILLGSWGVCPAVPEDCSADLNGTCVVDATDLVALLGNWGPPPKRR